MARMEELLSISLSNTQKEDVPVGFHSIGSYANSVFPSAVRKRKSCQKGEANCS